MANPNYYNLQKAIYEKLTGNIPLIAVISGVFDTPPQGTSFPYITIGDVAINDVSNLAKTGTDYQIEINIWSREGGHKQNSYIMDMVYALLHNGVITISGQNLVTMRVTASSIQLENDGWTYHGIMHLRVVLISA